ncbi:MAG: shikimate dehydrogenase, partial [Lysobacteraceae bacterium]
MRKHYAVFGMPIAHSLSPRIHAAFAKQAGIDLDYVAIEAPPGQFDRLLADFAEQGGLGANITLPLKRRACELATSHSGRALRMGVANTLVRTEAGWHADNTDGIGLVRDLSERQGLDLRARRTLLLGAGGGARAVAPALLDAGIGELFVVNRTAANA